VTTKRSWLEAQNRGRQRRCTKKVQPQVVLFVGFLRPRPAIRGRSPFGDGSARNLEMRPEEQLRHTNKSARGKIRLEVLAVDAVERIIESEICAIYLNRHEIIHGHAGILECLLELLHDVFRLLFRRKAGGELVGVCGSSGNIQCLADLNRAAERQVLLGGQFRFQEFTIALRSYGRPVRDSC